MQMTFNCDDFCFAPAEQTSKYRKTQPALLAHIDPDPVADMLHFEMHEGATPVGSPKRIKLLVPRYCIPGWY